MSTHGKRRYNVLAAAFVSKVTAPGHYHDGHGLILRVTAAGTKQWVQRLRIRGKRRELGLGGYPLVTLAMAREAALANRRKVHAGADPLAEKRQARGVPTFAEAARKVFALRRDGWRNAKHAGQWITTLEQFAFPRLGERGVDQLSTEDVIAVLGPIWHAKPATAKRVRQGIGAVLAWAVAQGLRPDNPADSVRAVLPKQGGGADPHRALPYCEVADAIAAVRASSAGARTKLAFEYLVLTAARAGEVEVRRHQETREPIAHDDALALVRRIMNLRGRPPVEARVDYIAVLAGQCLELRAAMVKRMARTGRRWRPCGRLGPCGAHAVPAPGAAGPRPGASTSGERAGVLWAVS